MSSLHATITWCPKYRRKVLVHEVAERLVSIIREVCQEREATLEALEVMPDVHLVVSIYQQFGIHRLMRLAARAVITTVAARVSQATEAPTHLVDQ